MPGKPKGLPKTGGRKKGTPNKVTSEMREKMHYVFNKLHGDIDEVIDGLTESEKAKFYLGIAEYILPKLQRTTIETPKDSVFEIKIVDGGRKEE